MKGLMLKEEGKLSVLGWVILMLVSILPPTIVSGALDLANWLDFALFVVWFVVVSQWARRVLGVRF